MDQGKVVRQVTDVQKLIVSIEDSKLFHEAFPAALLLSAWPAQGPRYAASLLSSMLISESGNRPKFPHMVVRKGERAPYRSHIYIHPSELNGFQEGIGRLYPQHYLMSESLLIVGLWLSHNSPGQEAGRCSSDLRLVFVILEGLSKVQSPFAAAATVKNLPKSISRHPPSSEVACRVAARSLRCRIVNHGVYLHLLSHIPLLPRLIDLHFRILPLS